MNKENKKPITWQELKDFVNSIPEDKLQDKARIEFNDEGCYFLLEPFFATNDLYIYDNDSDMVGDFDGIIEMLGDEEFNPELMTVIYEKGDPFLWLDTYQDYEPTENKD